jgi:hypothetical protein
VAKHTPAEIFVFSPHGGELLATPLPEEGALISFNVSRKDVREELVAAISLDGEILVEHLIQKVLAALLAHSSPSSLRLLFSLSAFLLYSLDAFHAQGVHLAPADATSSKQLDHKSHWMTVH